MRAAALLVLAAVTAAGELAGAERDIARAAQRVRASVVTVYTEEKKDWDLTGVVISSKGIVLTLRRPLLVNGSLPASVRVRFPGQGKTVDATVLGEDAATDTVLLQVRKVRATAIAIRRADDTRLGQWVMLVGNAFGSGRESSPTTSLGVVSGIVRDGDRIHELHASTLVNPGSFGAPIVDAGGGLIGITALSITGAGGQTVVLPIDYVRDRYRELGGEGARAFPTPPRKRTPSARVTDLFGVVMEDAVGRAWDAVVGVRAGKLPEDVTKPVAPDGGDGAGAKDAPKRKPQGPRPPPPVPGTLPAVDRSSGLAIRKDGWVLCPLRVTGWPGAPRPLTVDLRDGRSFPARVLGTDERLRVALLKIDASDLKVLEASARVRAGRFALAIGFPHDRPRQCTPQVTFGIVSRTGGLFGMHPAFQAVQTDAGVSGGNRGGALVDMDGRLLGMLLDVDDTSMQGYVTRKAGAYRGNAGLGFALPWATIQAIAPRLAKGAVLRNGFLGVSTFAGKDGIRITAVTEKNSANEATTAARAGLKVGDVLVAIGDDPMRKPEDLRAALLRYAVGDRVAIRYRRDGKETAVTVELGAR